MGQLGFESFRPKEPREKLPEESEHVILPVPGARESQPKMWTAQDLLNSLR